MKNVNELADFVAWNSSRTMFPPTVHVVPGTEQVRFNVSPVACSRSLNTTSPGSIGCPSSSIHALIVARAELEDFWLGLVCSAVVMLKVDSSVSIERVADTAPPFDVLSAAG